MIQIRPPVAYKPKHKVQIMNTKLLRHNPYSRYTNGPQVRQERRSNRLIIQLLKISLDRMIHQLEVLKDHHLDQQHFLEK